MVKGTRNIFLTHFIGWLIFMSLPAIFIFSLSADTEPVFTGKSLFNWSLFSIFIIIFYLHTFWLLPKYLLAKKYSIYISLLGFLLLLVMLLKPFDKIAVNGNKRPPEEYAPRTFDKAHPPPLDGGPPGQPDRRGIPVIDIVSLALFVLIIALSLALSFERIRQQAVTKAQNAVAGKIAAELALLKAQINPHFLFNTLNNIYSLALMQDENTAGSIFKFANIMRYVTEEVPGHLVPLKDEIDCINDYMDLQKLRMTPTTGIEFNHVGQIENKLIAPLLLITFVENAFKYGVSNNVSSAIKIKLTASENCIQFFCENSIFVKINKEEKGGVGIANTRKRLEHLYPGKYQLSIQKKEESFFVHLKIEG